MDRVREPVRCQIWISPCRTWPMAGNPLSGRLGSDEARMASPPTAVRNTLVVSSRERSRYDPSHGSTCGSLAAAVRAPLPLRSRASGDATCGSGTGGGGGGLGKGRGGAEGGGSGIGGGGGGGDVGVGGGGEGCGGGGAARGNSRREMACASLPSAVLPGTNRDGREAAEGSHRTSGTVCESERSSPARGAVLHCTATASAAVSMSGSLQEIAREVQLVVRVEALKG